MRPTQQTILTRCEHGSHTVPAWTTATPGLTVHAAELEPCHLPREKGTWVVTHERSGLGVSRTNDPESAQARAVELGRFGIDWTQSGQTIRDSDAYGKVRHPVSAGPRSEAELAVHREASAR